MEDNEKKPMSFDEKLACLEEINKQLSEGKTDLEKSVSLFEQGMKIAKEIEKDLSKLERRIEIVTSDPDADSDEGLATTDFKPESEGTIRK
ncbi:MAG: exodeoxyribonuclease VII small subunit [Sphaerochaetaceae bacterium]|jgi:exodeoxyribonuclease VII small subunit|nr:exodeoxyribonuclease VII small subunit [Sphaerochaetaceae bacterium]MDD3162712.1 exodeoxyribonuclease VII small subunit [Sphaerochaetaceae bacterium]MDD4007053.1 exodeoxyribonuclease VII small subunit [Sphaerochaetaceae bacterium]MDD4396687.1 exodeoxyribonuclease VII small subunit [Sphaerochaetaceae bacterium]